MTSPAGEPRLATAADMADWDHRAVRAPGGHVYQSTVWADQRARLGWRPHHVVLDADHVALVLLRPFPVVGGASAYVPRGPVEVPERVQALASATAAIERAPASVDMAMSFFMVAVSFG